MPSSEELSFGELLRQFRLDAGMTQEKLAEAAQLSPRTISDLERGVNHAARRETARLIAEALGLSEEDRRIFEAARRRETPDAFAAPTRTLPMDTACFTGREDELSALVNGAKNAKGTVAIYAIGGMAGVGKTALAIHAAHQLETRFPEGQIYLDLHAHTAGQDPVPPADALASLLRMVGVAAHQIPPGLQERSGLWRDRLAGKKLLLVFDDAVNSDQVRPLLPGAGGSVVLVTSRSRLTALDGGVVINLSALAPDAAAGLLVRLAARPGLDAGDPDIAEICRLCGYLPLALGLLASRMRDHETWSPADFVADLTQARDRLAPMHAEHLSVEAAFELSYRDLDAAEQRLFRRLGLHPGTDIDVYAAAALDDLSPEEARDRLEGLFDHYLLAESGRDRYYLHDLIREYARRRVAADPPEDRLAAAGRLLDYYLYNADVANSLLARGARAGTPGKSKHVKPEFAPEIADRDAALAWMSAESPNLNAAAGTAAALGRPEHAIAIPAAMHTFLRIQGHWDQALALNHAAVEAARSVDKQQAEARALIDLGEMQYLTDDYLNAQASLVRALRICADVGDRPGQADALRELGAVHLAKGDHDAAVANLARAQELYMSLGNKPGEAETLRELGTVQQVCGKDTEAMASLEQALELFRSLDDRLGEAEALSDIGAVQLARGDLSGAADSHLRALDLFQLLGDRLGEANALTDLGTVQHLSGQAGQSQATLDRALQIFQNLGDRSGEAKALNNLGELALTSGDPARAGDLHQRALNIADLIAAPHEQARAHEGLGHSYLARGQTEQGHESMRRAFRIYHKIGSPHAERISGLLPDCGK
jgi:tetratricopeptide (TPR) repeat protein/transcriptional regulator with XRE-family HTH domain